MLKFSNQDYTMTTDISRQINTEGIRTKLVSRSS